MIFIYPFVVSDVQVNENTKGRRWSPNEEKMEREDDSPIMHLGYSLYMLKEIKLWMLAKEL